jgi:hypothetical protein
MKRVFAWVMLVSIIPAVGVSAAALEDVAGLGQDRASLTPALVAARTRRLEESTTFSLLRFPEALQAPARIFDPDLWNIIERAARENDLDPMMLAGIIFVESYGDPLAKSPTGPAGIAQLTKSSAKEMGLSTNRKVQTGWRTVTKTKYVGRGKNRRQVIETKREAIYKRIDERYQPERAISAMARRLKNRREWLGGKMDFAIAEYHMGAGRMAKLLSAYFDRKIKIGDVPGTMRSSSVSYPQLFWSNTPYYRPDVYKQIQKLNDVDYSPTYYFRVRQAMRLLERYRSSRSDYLTLARNYQNRFGRVVLPGWQWTFVSETEVPKLALRNLSDLSAQLGARFVPLPEIATDFRVRPRLTGDYPIGEADLANQDKYIAAERSTIGCMLFVAEQLQQLQGAKYAGFETNNMVTHLATEEVSDKNKKKNPHIDPDLPMHAFGWAFDIPLKGLSKDQVRDLKFILTDLRQAGLLTFAEEGKGKSSAFHIVRHPDHAERFEQFYWQAVGTPVGMKQPESEAEPVDTTFFA